MEYINNLDGKKVMLRLSLIYGSFEKVSVFQMTKIEIAIILNKTKPLHFVKKKDFKHIEIFQNNQPDIIITRYFLDLTPPPIILIGKHIKIVSCNW